LRQETRDPGVWKELGNGVPYWSENAEYGTETDAIQLQQYPNDFIYSDGAFLGVVLSSMQSAQHWSYEYMNLYYHFCLQPLLDKLIYE
jgi:hypothetical protein